MAKTITITNGSGSSELINATYTITSEVTGYNNASVNPASVTVTEGVNSYALTIAATGTLTLHVTEDGTAGGTAIVGATFSRCDSSGNTYGTAVVSDANGDAVFNNVPFADTNAPVIYYKQTASDGNHEFDATLANTTMTTSTATIQITNAPGATRTINLTDENYTGLPIESGTLTFTN